jgi:hypothetical protein
MVVPTFSQTSNQSTCNLTISQSPTVRGIRLGMSAEEVFALFPGSAERQDYKDAILSAQVSPNYGVARLYFQPAAYLSPAKERFSGIDSISITLFDGRATEISVAYTGYPKGPSWLNVDDFITKLSDAFALPSAKDWQTTGEFSKTLKCSGFEIRALLSNRNGYMSLSNNSYTETVRQRAAADEERRRREFKP